MARLARVHEEGGRPGGREGRRDLAADMAGLAHAGDDHPAARLADQVDGGDERGAEPVAHRGRERPDPLPFGLQRALGRFDQGAVRSFSSSRQRLIGLFIAYFGPLGALGAFRLAARPRPIRSRNRTLRRQ